MTKSKGILPPRRLWTEEETAWLAVLYPDIKTELVAEVLRRTIVQCHRKAWALGLRKSAEFLARPARRADNVGKAYRFAPGLVPWNKGLKGFDAGGRSAETRFKKGERRGAAAHNWVPIGSERVTEDGYLQRKITDTGYSPRDWKSVHIILWEKHHGPVPPDHVVVFENGDKTKIEIDNLPQELVQVVQLRAVITRKINRAKKKAKA